MARGRDEFALKTLRTLSERANMMCSNPGCRRMTGGYHSDSNKRMNLAKASHIRGAAENGPRYDADQTPQQRSSIENAIWLCSLCADMVDKDEKLYTSELLYEWKRTHERWVTEQRETDVAQQRFYREERRKRLEILRDQLLKVQQDYANYLTRYPANSDTGDPEKHKRIVDRAIHVCISAGDIGDDECRRSLDILADKAEFEAYSRRYDKMLAYIARLRLTPYFVTGQSVNEGDRQRAEVNRWGRYETRNKDAIADAILRFDVLTSDLGK